MILLTFLFKCLHRLARLVHDRIWPFLCRFVCIGSLLIQVSTLYRKNLVSTKFTGYIVKPIYNRPTIEMGQLLYFKTIQIHTCYSHLKSPYAKSNTYSIWAEIWMKARTNTGKQRFLFYRINIADSFSALVLLWDRSLIYWQPGLPAVFLDQSQKHQSGSKVQPSKTSSHSRVCSTRKE